MFTAEIRERAETIKLALEARGQMIVTAESCTGGLIAGALTEVPGSSATVFGGFVTYDNRAKIEMVGVPEALIARHGAVSEQVARAMAEGALCTAGVAVSIAVTGVAGPGGGSAEKPVGLVHFACATAVGTVVEVRRFGDQGRQRVRELTVAAALDLVITTLAL